MNSNILSFYIDEGNRSKIDNLEFVFATVDKQIDERTVESMLYDLECEFLYTFGPVANKRKQRPSYLQNSI